MPDYPDDKSYNHTGYKKSEQYYKHPPGLVETNTYNVHNTEGEGKEPDNMGENPLDEVYYYGPNIHDNILFFADIVSLFASILISIHYYPIMPEDQLTLIMFPCIILINVLITRFVGMLFQGMGVAWLIIQVFLLVSHV